MVSHLCLLEVNPIWSWCINFLICNWISLLAFYWKFYININKEYWSLVFFTCSVFNWLWYQGYPGLIKRIWKSSLICCLEKSQRILFEMTWKLSNNHCWNPACSFYCLHQFHFTKIIPWTGSVTVIPQVFSLSSALMCFQRQKKIS